MNIYDAIDERVEYLQQEEFIITRNREKQKLTDYGLFESRLRAFLTEEDWQVLSFRARYVEGPELNGLATFEFDGNTYELYANGSAGFSFYRSNHKVPTHYNAANRDALITSLASIRLEAQDRAQA